MKNTITKAALALTVSALVLSATSEMAVASAGGPPNPPAPQDAKCATDLLNWLSTFPPGSNPLPKTAVITVMVQADPNTAVCVFKLDSPVGHDITGNNLGQLAPQGLTTNVYTWCTGVQASECMNEIYNAGWQAVNDRVN